MDGLSFLSKIWGIVYVDLKKYKLLQDMYTMYWVYKRQKELFKDV